MNAEVLLYAFTGGLQKNTIYGNINKAKKSPTTKKNKVWTFFGATFVLVRPSAHACDPTTS